ncbi:hypothetical protein Tco_0010219 [Tanacetum coccineum]
MRTCSSSHLIAESSATLKRRNRRRSKQRVEPFSLEETPVVTMADQRTMAELLRAPTEGYAEAIVIVTTSRYVVPTGRVKVPVGRYVVLTGKDNVIVSAGRTILLVEQY